MMKHLLLAAMLLVAACRKEVATNVDPVALTPETVGYFCQMTLLEHPGPKAQVHLEGFPGTPRFFSQVRDAVVYQRLPEQVAPILAIYVSDMGAATARWDAPGATNWIAADTAFYVVGSDARGGMDAPEFVPFAARDKAEAFAAAHGGAVLRLGEIPASAVAPSDAAFTGTDDYAARLKSGTDRTGE